MNKSLLVIGAMVALACSTQLHAGDSLESRLKEIESQAEALQNKIVRAEALSRAVDVLEIGIVALEKGKGPVDSKEKALLELIETGVSHIHNEVKKQS